jgi:hypothetical protein
VKKFRHPTDALSAMAAIVLLGDPSPKQRRPTMDATRYFGLDSLEWAVMLGASVLIAVAMWMA